MAHKKQPANSKESEQASPSLETGVKNLPVVLEAIRKNLDGLQYGQVTAIIHDGVAVQVDRTERTRLV